MAKMTDLQHVLVIGPGLGRDQHMQDCARIAFELAKGMEMGVVVDADGLWLVQVCFHPFLICNQVSRLQEFRWTYG